MQRLRQLTFASLEHDRKKRRTRHDPDLRRRLERNTQRLAPLPGFSNLMIAQPHLIMTGEKRVWNLPDRPCGGSTGGDSAPKTRIWGSGPQKIGRRSREGRFPQPKPEKTPQIRGSLISAEATAQARAWQAATGRNQPWRQSAWTRPRC